MKNNKISPVIKIGLGLFGLILFLGFVPGFLKSPRSFYLENKVLFFTVIIFFVVLLITKLYAKYVSPTSSDLKMFIWFILSLLLTGSLLYSIPRSGDLGEAIFLYLVVIPINFLLGGILLIHYLSKKFGDKKLKNYSLIIMGSLLVILSIWALIHNLL